MHCGVNKFYVPKGPRLLHMTVMKTPLRAWGFIKFIDSTVHVHNCFRLYLWYNVLLLFVICKSSNNSLHKNFEIEGDICKSAMATGYVRLPWAPAYICDVIFWTRVCKLSSCQLPWFKGKWKPTWKLITYFIDEMDLLLIVTESRPK